MAEAYQLNENVCGRVIAMLARKDDAASSDVAELVRAVEAPPRVIARPTLRLDVCLAMLCVGALLALLVLHLAAESGGDQPSTSECGSAADSSQEELA